LELVVGSGLSGTTAMGCGQVVYSVILYYELVS